MSGNWIFLLLVSIAVFLLAQGLTMPVFGDATRVRKRLQSRLAAVGAVGGQARLKSLLREKYLKELTPLEQSLEQLPGMQALARLIEQSGRTTPAYRLVFTSAAIGAGAAIAGWMLSRISYVAVAAGVAGVAIPILKMLRDRAQRMAKFEEQLPEALDMIKRALRAGHPFTQSLKLISEDMDEPISREFEYVFTEINYGSDLRAALLGMVERMPSVSVMAFTTAVLVQKETGGNLAETLERITAVIRGRFKLHRRIRTLSAEGRLSAWILTLVPFVLFAVISFMTPAYLPTLVRNPRGPTLIMGACVLGAVGILWIRRIIRIRV